MRTNKLRLDSKGCQKRYKKYQGMVAIILLVGLTVILSIIGMSVDFGHAYLNKTRLQNLADSLALTGAKTLNDTRTTTQAYSAITNLFELNINTSGYRELQEKLELDDISIEFSNKLYPFQSRGSNPRYVRISISSIQLQSWFIRVLGLTKIPISAVSVAGPSSSLSPLVCDVAGVMICGDSSDDPESNNNTSFWGYVPGTAQLLKAGSNTDFSCVGPGNYQLVSIGDGGSGANEVRETLAGNYEACTDFSSGIVTKPGNTAGPVSQGLNTRFGDYQGPMKHRQDEFPPDVVTTSLSSDITFEEGVCQGGEVVDLDFSWQDYKQAVSNGLFNYAPPIGVIGRRILKVPIGDCSQFEELNGRVSIPYLGLGCFFLLNKIDGKTENIYGEFIEECMQDGIVGQQSGQTSGPYKIILYENPSLS